MVGLGNSCRNLFTQVLCHSEYLSISKRCNVVPCDVSKYFFHILAEVP
jgi:hypothetical protein